MRALSELLKSAQALGEKTYRTPRAAAIAGGVSFFNEDIAVSRLTTYLLWRDRGELAYPVVFPFEGIKALPSSLKRRHNVLSVVLKRFPSPTSDLPLEDIVAFKRDSETQHKFDQFWAWTRRLSKQDVDTHELEEELDFLITDYSAHLKQLTTETGHQRLKSFSQRQAIYLKTL